MWFASLLPLSIFWFPLMSERTYQPLLSVHTYICECVCQFVVYFSFVQSTFRRLLFIVLYKANACILRSYNFHNSHYLLYESTTSTTSSSDKKKKKTFERIPKTEKRPRCLRRNNKWVNKEIKKKMNIIYAITTYFFLEYNKITKLYGEQVNKLQEHTLRSRD